MSALDQLYQQVILDHARERHGYGLRDAVTGSAMDSHQYNPLCGDEITLRVELGTVDGDGLLVRDVSWAGSGCSISQASASVLYDLVVGRSVAEADSLVTEFRSMIRSRGAVEPDEDVLGDAVAFAGVGRHANRVKCAMLGWTAFEDAVARAAAVAGERGDVAGDGGAVSRAEACHCGSGGGEETTR